MSRDAIALRIFRSRYGCAADPEFYPRLWEHCLNLADEQLDDVELDEGGEA